MPVETYIVAHSYEGGRSYYLVQGDHEPTPEEVLGILDVGEGAETIEIVLVKEDDIVLLPSSRRKNR